MLEPLSISLGLIIGGGLGTIAGGLFAAGRIADWRDEFNRAVKIADAAIDERDELQRWKDTVLSGFMRNAAARKQAKIDRDNAARELQNARHAEMKRLVGEVI